MINVNMREYYYYLYGEPNAYGQPTLSEDVCGTIKMAIYNSNKSLTSSIEYTGGHYIGLTYDKQVNDKYVIQFGDIQLKVLYTIPCAGQPTQVMMSEV